MFLYDALSRRTGVALANGQFTSVGYFHINVEGFADVAPKSQAHCFTAGRDIAYGFAYNKVNQIKARTLSDDTYTYRSFDDNGALDYTVQRPQSV